jgi:hypothetical protein
MAYHPRDARRFQLRGGLQNLLGQTDDRGVPPDEGEVRRTRSKDAALAGAMPESGDAMIEEQVRWHVPVIPMTFHRSGPPDVEVLKRVSQAYPLRTPIIPSGRFGRYPVLSPQPVPAALSD